MGTYSINIKNMHERCTCGTNYIFNNHYFSISHTGNREHINIVDQEEFFFVVEGDVYPSVEDSRLHVMLKSFSTTKKLNDYNFYGQYFIILINKTSLETIIFCDPCGQYPVFFWDGDGYTFKIHTCLNSIFYEGHEISVNWEYIQNYLLFGSGGEIYTGIKNLRKLRPGFALVMKSGKTFEEIRIWNPVNKKRINSLSINPLDILKQVLSDKLENKKDIYLELSGGVESTAIAVAMHEIGIASHSNSVTYYDSNRSSSNELLYAKKVSNFSGFNHQELSLLESLPFSPQLESIPLTVIPYTQLCFLEQQRFLAKNFPIFSTIVNGHGGDALFLAPPPMSLFIESFLEKGLKKSLSSLYNLALIHRTSFLDVLTKGVVSAFNTFRVNNLDKNNDVINPVCINKHDISFLFEDIINDKSLIFYPTTRFQLASFSATLDETMMQLYFTGQRSFFPFLCQPMVQFAFDCNTSEFISGRYNRFVIRKNIYKKSLLKNLWRTDKGETTRSVLMGIEKNYDYISDLCLNGECVKNGLINKGNFEKILKKSAVGFPIGLQLITRVFSTEIFMDFLTSKNIIPHQNYNI